MHNDCLGQFRVVAELLEANQKARFRLERRVSKLEADVESLLNTLADVCGTWTTTDLESEDRHHG